MDIKHTPGPWEAGDVDNEEQEGIPIFARNKAKLAYYVAIARYMGTADPAPARANARLIAAAPDLLAAVEQVLIASEDNGDMEDIDWNMLRAAVKKAKG